MPTIVSVCEAGERAAIEIQSPLRCCGQRIRRFGQSPEGNLSPVRHYAQKAYLETRAGPMAGKIRLNNRLLCPSDSGVEAGHAERAIGILSGEIQLPNRLRAGCLCDLKHLG
jgi:hypothetical protein